MKVKQSIAERLMREYRGMHKSLSHAALYAAIKYCYRSPTSWTCRFKDDSILWFHNGSVMPITKEEALKKWKRV